MTDHTAELARFNALDKARTQGEWKFVPAKESYDGDAVEAPAKPGLSFPQTICDNTAYYPAAVSVLDMHFIAAAPAILSLANTLHAQLEQLEKENAELRVALNPRQWTQAMHDAWHKALPDTQAAFEALTKEALNPSPEPSHES